ncbi:hypothetical protein Ddye_011212 [Dipteronia dyeriana]|uniref:DUF8040 domain-containing protein n=1 Tax=Dipteronia dyeriana TaxID=168575 RepID=A0AAD9UBA0_9ROSI|nr:hypothetical protein Ddye_011212 [Dipteronia dyeriana]
MDRNVFAMLCELLKTHDGLLDDGNVIIEEQVASFVHILAHHVKNRSIQGCLGALDVTCIEMIVPESDKPRMYMDVDPEEYTPITLDELPIREDIPNELESINVIEASDEWSQ